MRNLLIDAILLVLFVAELCFHHLPPIVHEILGVAMAVLIVIHFALNFRRFVTMFKKISTRKIFCLEVNITLIIVALIILFTGFCMSNYLFAGAVGSALRRSMTIHQLHTSTPYLMLILIGMHLGLHWYELRQRLLNLLELEKISGSLKFFSKAIFVTLIIFGTLGLFLNRFLDRIFMKHIFATPATDLPAWIFILMMFGGIVLFAAITFAVTQKVFRR